MAESSLCERASGSSWTQASALPQGPDKKLYSAQPRSNSSLIRQRPASVPAVSPIACLYSQQDEFKRHLTGLWAAAKANKSYGERLSDLRFGDMRDVPGLQAADLLAWEFRHYYHLRRTRPDLRVRVPFQVLIEHQLAQGIKRLKFLPGWYLEAQANGIQQAVMSVVMENIDRYGFLYRDLAPPALDDMRDLRLMGLLGKYARSPYQPPGFERMLKSALSTRYGCCSLIPEPPRWDGPEAMN